MLASALRHCRGKLRVGKIGDRGSRLRSLYEKSRMTLAADRIFWESGFRSRRKTIFIALGDKTVTLRIAKDQQHTGHESYYDQKHVKGHFFFMTSPFDLGLHDGRSQLRGIHPGIVKTGIAILVFK